MAIYKFINSVQVLFPGSLVNFSNVSMFVTRGKKDLLVHFLVHNNINNNINIEGYVKSVILL